MDERLKKKGKPLAVLISICGGGILAGSSLSYEQYLSLLENRDIIIQYQALAVANGIRIANGACPNFAAICDTEEEAVRAEWEWNANIAEQKAMSMAAERMRG